MRDIVSPDPSPADIRRGYEGTAIKVRGMVYFAVAFVLCAAAIHTIVWFILVGLEHTTAEANAERFPPPVLELDPVGFPRPQIQPSPGHERMPWEDQYGLLKEQIDSLKASKAFEKISGAERGTTGGLPFLGKAMPALRISGQIVKAVGDAVGQSRTAPTTLPAGSGAAGNQPGTQPVQPSATPATQPAGPTTAPAAGSAADEKKGEEKKSDEKKAGTEETGEKR